MKKFEYKIVIGNQDLVVERDQLALNDFGADGWELVATDVIKSFKMDGILGGKRQIYWLKKEISE